MDIELFSRQVYYFQMYNSIKLENKEDKCSEQYDEWGAGDFVTNIPESDRFPKDSRESGFQNQNS